MISRDDISFSCKYVLVIARVRVQYEQYFSSSSYFADLLHEALGKLNNKKI